MYAIVQLVQMLRGAVFVHALVQVVQMFGGSNVWGSVCVCHCTTGSNVGGSVCVCHCTTGSNVGGGAVFVYAIVQLVQMLGGAVFVYAIVQLVQMLGGGAVFVSAIVQLVQMFGGSVCACHCTTGSNVGGGGGQCLCMQLYNWFKCLGAVFRNQESGNVYLSQNTQITLYKNIVNIMHNNYNRMNGKTQNTMTSTQKRDGRLQLRPKLIAIAGATQTQNKTSPNNR